MHLIVALCQVDSTVMSPEMKREKTKIKKIRRVNMKMTEEEGNI